MILGFKLHSLQRFGEPHSEKLVEWFQVGNTSEYPEEENAYSLWRHLPSTQASLESTENAPLNISSLTKTKKHMNK